MTTIAQGEAPSSRCAVLRSDRAIPLYLGYGAGDRFAISNGLLAAALPPGHVFTTPGGHDWRTWTRLWVSFLGACPPGLRPFGN